MTLASSRALLIMRGSLALYDLTIDRSWLVKQGHAFARRMLI